MRIIEFYARPYEINNLAKHLLEHKIVNFFIEEFKEYEPLNKSACFLPRLRIFIPIKSKDSDDIITKIKLILNKVSKDLHKTDRVILKSRLLENIDIEVSKKN